LSFSIENPKNRQFEQLKVVIILREGKEVNNKVSEKKHDKEERSKTNETDHKIANNASPSSNVSDPVVAYK